MTRGMSSQKRVNAKLVNGLPLTKNEEAVYDTLLEREMEKALKVALVISEEGVTLKRKAG
jgi:hypothetical protein